MPVARRERLSDRRTRRPFKVLYAGRIEEDKGALDVIDIATQLLATSPQGYSFDICGDGSALALLRERVRARNLEHCIRVHGRLARAALIERYLDTHVVLVPTRASEGFAMVVAEAILCLRPVISCAVVPAAQTFACAVSLANSEDIDSYADAVRLLSTDAERYSTMVGEARRLRCRILDADQSLRNVLRTLGPSLRQVTRKTGRSALTGLVRPEVSADSGELSDESLEPEARLD